MRLIEAMLMDKDEISIRLTCDIVLNCNHNLQYQVCIQSASIYRYRRHRSLPPKHLYATYFLENFRGIERMHKTLLIFLSLVVPIFLSGCGQKAQKGEKTEKESKSKEEKGEAKGDKNTDEANNTGQQGTR